MAPKPHQFWPETLFNATAVDHEDTMGAWRVTEVCDGKLGVNEHCGHTAGMGLSSWLEDKPVGRGTLKPGDKLVGFRELHTLEGTLRAAARRDGRFLAVGAVIGSSTGPQEFAITCVLDAARCNFLVKFSDINELRKGAQKGKERWTCVEIRSEHTCVSSAAEPQERLLWRMDFFPPIRLVDGHTGKPTQTKPSGRGTHVPQCDQSIGPFPVRDRSPTPESNDAGFAGDSSEEERSPSPSRTALVAVPDPLASQRAALLRAERDLSSAEEELNAATRRVDERRRLVEKKRRRLDEAWEEHGVRLPLARSAPPPQQVVH
ncbi:hypothetical protein JCM9279_005889 [Rhodotorula babjevae]